MKVDQRCAGSALVQGCGIRSRAVYKNIPLVSFSLTLHMIMGQDVSFLFYSLNVGVAEWMVC